MTDIGDVCLDRTDRRLESQPLANCPSSTTRPVPLRSHRSEAAESPSSGHMLAVSTIVLRLSHATNLKKSKALVPLEGKAFARSVLPIGRVTQAGRGGRSILMRGLGTPPGCSL